MCTTNMNKKDAMNIWFAIVQIKPLKNNKRLKGADGAYVNVAYAAESQDDFIDKINLSFKENDFKVIEIDEIENKDTVSIDNPENAEKLELLNDIEVEKFDFSWGVFHTY